MYMSLTALFLVKVVSLDVRARHVHWQLVSILAGAARDPYQQVDEVGDGDLAKITHVLSRPNAVHG